MRNANDRYAVTMNAIEGQTVRFKSMADGTLRAEIDIHDGESRQFYLQHFSDPGIHVAIAKIAATSVPEENEPEADYGQYAKALRLSDFMRSPTVWAALGTDSEYLDWVRNQPSAFSGRLMRDEITGKEYCIAMHVRRAGSGAGTGIKPRYSAIPGTHEEHELQHQKGETALAPREVWEKKALDHVTRWAWEKLREVFEVESMREVHPQAICEWAFANNCFSLLPEVIRSHAEAV